MVWLFRDVKWIKKLYDFGSILSLSLFICLRSTIIINIYIYKHLFTKLIIFYIINKFLVFGRFFKSYYFCVEN
jgi:hypothetical protein